MFVEFQDYSTGGLIYIDPFKVVAVLPYPTAHPEEVTSIWTSGGLHFEVHCNIENVIHQIEEAVNR